MDNTKRNWYNGKNIINTVISKCNYCNYDINIYNLNSEAGIMLAKSELILTPEKINITKGQCNFSGNKIDNKISVEKKTN